ncbi:hypothetical protein AVEN_61888-1 [Araneus ventricosus]|uniref:Uncharacterized protein n=1 Tax=Araneus ventricosus TaxID=182803 RepID=A0A4Y2TX30_ARAVE|nr:hypothetical protein AVEN_78808-1 [Araneus ventricosus]GBO04010.1 hypothetical protein AVEN_61888-1 [Araneus ventricosus]
MQKLDLVPSIYSDGLSSCRTLKGKLADFCASFGGRKSPAINPTVARNSLLMHTPVYQISINDDRSEVSLARELAIDLFPASNVYQLRHNAL